jgi:hypothetical protein
MAERTSLTQIVQLGMEVQAGTAVAATKRLTSLSIEPSAKAEPIRFRPAGSKYPTIIVPGKEWSEAAVSGYPTYTELVYALSSLLCKTTPVQQGDTAAYLWEFDPSASDEDEVQTFTIEHGSSVRSDRFSYGLFRDLTLTVDRSTSDLSGTMFGQLFDDNVALSAGATELALVPILPKQWDIYVDDTHAALGSTKMTRHLRFSFGVSNRFGQVWPIDSSQDSFAAHVEIEPTAELRLLAEADAQGMAYLSAMRAGTTKFVRLEAKGATIEVPYVYRCTIDLAVKVSEPSEFSDEDGVYALEWTLPAVYDGGWGRAFKWEIVNALSAL